MPAYCVNRHAFSNEQTNKQTKKCRHNYREPRDWTHTYTAEKGLELIVGHTLDTLLGNKRKMFYEGWETVIFAIN